MNKIVIAISMLMISGCSEGLKTWISEQPIEINPAQKGTRRSLMRENSYLYCLKQYPANIRKSQCEMLYPPDI